MRENRRAAATPCATTAPDASAKVGNEKDLCKVFDYFRYKVGTSLDCALDLGILRNSITWYIDELEKLGELQAVCRRLDRTTGFPAKHYSADRSLWKKKEPRELDLFSDVPSAGEVMRDLSHAPIRDRRSGEVNIMALYQQRKEAKNGK